MKKLINKVENIVDEMLEGIAAAHPKLVERLEGRNILVRKGLNKNKVTLISGGGSGHEPSHGGYVGKGMLDAAVAGEVFTSPAADAVLAAIQAVGGPKGTLLVVKNYTGDVMNFEMAGEMAEGIPCKQVVVNDDIALENSLYTVGRRGIAGTIFVHKIAGAKAEKGASLEEVHALAEKVVKNMASIGMSLDACIVPANGKKGFELNEDEVEMGLGIHGEPGTHRMKLQPADEHVSYMMGKIFEEIKPSGSERVVLMVNGLGATPLMELYIIARKALQLLGDKKITVVHTMVGNYMTAIEMPGFSLSVLKLDKEMEELFFAPCNTPVWTQ